MAISNAPRRREAGRDGHPLSRGNLMAISTYAELQAAIGKWLARDDLGASIPDFIALAEQRLFYGADDASFPSPPLRLGAMEATTDPLLYATLPGVATLPLPPGFLETRSVTLSTQPKAALDLASSRQVAGEAGSMGRPRLYAIDGDALRLGPTPDAAYGVELAYFRRFEPLATTPSNWLLANAPGVYLYAALLEAQPFLMNDARLPVWAAMLGAATRALSEADRRGRWAGAARLRADAPTP
jgi:hypothetical protein